MKKSILIIAISLLSMLILAACGSTSTAQTSGVVTVPAPYAGKTNPLANDPQVIEKGKKVYTNDCASCHGEKGLGDGPAASALDPKPKNLVDSAKNNKEDYLFWRISEGGSMKPFNSSMPGWKGVETEESIWQVVSYIKSLK
jgi:mono/diheme cytochrome c family protein